MNTQSDILSDVLSSMRICGSLLLHEAYAPPWGISIPHTNQLGVLLGSRAGTRVVAFHLVERGYLTLTPTDGCACVVEAGEMVICFGGGAHQISQGLKPQILSIERLLQSMAPPQADGVWNSPF